MLADVYKLKFSRVHMADLFSSIQFSSVMGQYERSFTGENGLGARRVVIISCSTAGWCGAVRCGTVRCVVQVHIGVSSVSSWEVLYNSSCVRRHRESILRCSRPSRRPSLLLAVLRYRTRGVARMWCEGGGHKTRPKRKLEAIQKWSAICRVWPWTLTHQKFFLCISSQGHSRPILTQKN